MVNKLWKLKEFILTYPQDYCGQLSIGLIVDKLTNLGIDKDYWDSYVCHSIEKENSLAANGNSHYHVWNKPKDENTFIFTRNHKYFDIKLDYPVISFYKVDDKGKRRWIGSEFKDYFELNKQTYEEYAELIGADEWKEIIVAHPNIQKRKEFGSSYEMLMYCHNQAIASRFTFDWESTVDRLYKEKAKKDERKRKRENKKTEISAKELEFILWLVDLIHEQKLTLREVKTEIKNNKDYAVIYYNRYNNYRQILRDEFKSVVALKPSINWDLKFIIPCKLYDYLVYLDNWVKIWYTDRSKKEYRPKSLVLTGDSRSGKTSLMVTMGSFSYFKNMWNVDNVENQASFNIFDDMDSADEGKGLSFAWFKGWFGAQDCLTVTDRYKPRMEISNGKPLVWLNNYKIEESFKSISGLNYIRKNCVLVELKEGEDLYSPKDRSTIGGFAAWREWDPKKTWYYQNKIHSGSVTNTDIDILNASSPGDNTEEFSLLSSEDFTPLSSPRPQSWLSESIKNLGKENQEEAGPSKRPRNN